eukprot:11149171-Heterocapsa_arctica.AAC.1
MVWDTAWAARMSWVAGDARTAGPERRRRARGLRAGDGDLEEHAEDRQPRHRGAGPKACGIEAPLVRAGVENEVVAVVA